MNFKELKAQLEAVLFATGEPVEITRLSECLEIDEETLSGVAEHLKAELDERGSGLCILKLDNKYQLCTRTQYADCVRRILEVRKNAPLSNAAFEVLAIVAYNQPVTKSFVEQIRGVDSSGVMTSLLKKNLIEEKGRLDLPGRPLLYGTTPEFLKCFCISSLEELPSLPGNEAGETQMTFDETAEKEEREENLIEDLSEKVDEN